MFVVLPATRPLQDKARVLVTNQLQFVRSADSVIFMAGGQIAEAGTYQKLMDAKAGFAKLMEQTEVCHGDWEAHAGNRGAQLENSCS